MSTLLHVYITGLCLVLLLPIFNSIGSFEYFQWYHDHTFTPPPLHCYWKHLFCDVHIELLISIPIFRSTGLSWNFLMTSTTHLSHLVPPPFTIQGWQVMVRQSLSMTHFTRALISELGLGRGHQGWIFNVYMCLCSCCCHPCRKGQKCGGDVIVIVFVVGTRHSWQKVHKKVTQWEQFPTTGISKCTPPQMDLNKLWKIGNRSHTIFRKKYPRIFSGVYSDNLNSGLCPLCAWFQLGT